MPCALLWLCNTLHAVLLSDANDSLIYCMTLNESIVITGISIRLSHLYQKENNLNINFIYTSFNDEIQTHKFCKFLANSVRANVYQAESLFSTEKNFKSFGWMGSSMHGNIPCFILKLHFNFHVIPCADLILRILLSSEWSFGSLFNWKSIQMSHRYLFGSNVSTGPKKLQSWFGNMKHKIVLVTVVKLSFHRSRWQICVT